MSNARGQIWFAFSQKSHTIKMKPLMLALAREGYPVGAISPDTVIPPANACRGHVLALGFPVEEVPEVGFDATRHRLRQELGKRKFSRWIAGFLRRHHVAALVFGSLGPLLNRAMNQASRRRGIRTVLLTDGVLAPLNPAWRPGMVQRLAIFASRALDKALPSGNFRAFASLDLILVINKMAKQQLVCQGVSPGRVRVVGSAEYDDLAREMSTPLTANAEKSLRARLGIAATPPVLLFAHQHFRSSEQTRQLVRSLMASVRQCGAFLLVKLHPRGRDSPDGWARWARAEGLSDTQITFVKGECTSPEAVRLCAACATFYSTVGLEAMMGGKPLVMIQYPDVRLALPYGTRYGAALEVRNPDKLPGAVVAALTDAETRQRLIPNAKAAVKEELCGLDGRSVERMTEAIKTLLAKSRATRPKR